MLEAQLVHKCHAAVRDEANERVLGNEIDRLLQGVLELTELIRVNGRVDEQKKDRLLRFSLARHWRDDILDCREVWHQLSWQLLLADMLGVVLGEVVLVGT